MRQKTKINYVNSKLVNEEKVIQNKKKNDLIFKSVVYTFAIFSIIAVFLILCFVLAKSIFFLHNESFWAFITGKNWNPTAGDFGIAIIIFWTFMLLFLTLLFTIPLAIFTAVYICEYLTNDIQRRVIGTIRLLAGIPSVLFGLFALTQISPLFIKLGSKQQGNLLLSAIVLTFMTLPVMLSLLINSIKAVPNSYRSGSLALGLSKSYTSFRVILRSARVGLISSIAMAIARIIGETMAVIMIAGNAAPSGSLPNMHGIGGFLFASIRTLAGTIGLEILENAGQLHESSLYTIGLMLFIIVILINSLILLAQSISLKKQRKIKLHSKKNTKHLKRKHLNPSQLRELIWSKSEDQRLSKISNGIRLALMISSTTIVISFTLWIFLTIMIKGFIAISLGFVSQYGASVGITPINIFGLFLTTILLIILTIAFAFPLSLFVAILLTEYSNKHSKFLKFLNFSLDVMASTPSIIFGLFGLSFFIGFLHLPLSIFASALTLTFLVLPLMTRAIASSINDVPNDYRYASLALGNSKAETITKVVIPNSTRGIITGIILSVARVMGESAPVYLTQGSVARMPHWGFASPGTTLSVKIYMIFKEASTSQALDIAYILGLIIITTVLVLNFLSHYLLTYFSPSYIKITCKEKWTNMKNKLNNNLRTFKKLFNQKPKKHK